MSVIKVIIFKNKVGYERMNNYMNIIYLNWGKYELDNKKIIAVKLCIHSFIFTFHLFMKNRPNDQLPVGLLAQLVRALHRLSQRSQVRIPYKPDFFFFFLGFLFTTVVYLTAMIFFLSNSKLAIQGIYVPIADHSCMTEERFCFSWN